MLLKGNQRGGGRQMALHLLNGEGNEHVHVHEVSGFIASDVLGAFNEAHAISKGTKCRQFMYSLSLNPPLNENVPIETFEQTLERVEKKLGLEGQPRVVVFHEKEGRRHAHCVWSRIDTDNMKAINIAHDRRKLNDLSKNLFIEQGWQMPEGFRDKNRKNPLNYNRAEWQQAARIGRKPQEIKRELQECWAVSDNKQSFENALRETGYYLAKGDKRGFVVLDIHGEVYSLSRQLGVKQAALSERLGKSEALPSVSETKMRIDQQLSNLFKKYTNELSTAHHKQMQPLLQHKQSMTLTHRNIREKLKNYQSERWQSEQQRRSTRIRKGFKGLLDKFNGRYWKTRKQNEQEAWQSHLRDQKQREELINQQLTERQSLQIQLNLLREQQNQERIALIRDLSHISPNDHAPDTEKLLEPDHVQTHEPDHWDEQQRPEIDLEPDF